MTTAAWTMLAVTWTIVVYFTARFFWLVLTSPQPEDLDDTTDGILRKDA
jgi:hypothetical protein